MLLIKPNAKKKKTGVTSVLTVRHKKEYFAVKPAKGKKRYAVSSTGIKIVRGTGDDGVERDYVRLACKSDRNIQILAVRENESV